MNGVFKIVNMNGDPQMADLMVNQNTISGVGLGGEGWDGMVG